MLINLCDESIREWNKIPKRAIHGRNKTYPWQKPRCGYMSNNIYCEHKSHFSSADKHKARNVDACDRNVMCYNHRNMKNPEREKQIINMERIIIERIKKQKELFVSEYNSKYIEELKKKYV